MEVCLLTPADLEKFAHLFPPELPKELPGDELLIGCAEAQPPEAAGILMARVEAGELIVDWLYVDEDFRRRGGGKAMLELLVGAAEASRRVDGVSVVFSERAEHMQQLLRRCDFLVLSRGDDCGYLTELGDFPRLPVPGEPGGTLAALADVPAQELGRFASVVDKGLAGTAAPVPFDAGAFLPESAVCIADGKIRGACLLGGDGSGLSIEWIYSGASEPATIPALVNESVGRLKAKYPAGTKLGFASVNGSVREIVEKYIPVKERVEVYFATYRLDETPEE